MAFSAQTGYIMPQE